MQGILPKPSKVRRKFPNTFILTQDGSDFGFVVHMVATRVVRIEVQVVYRHRQFDELRLRGSLARDQVTLSLLVYGEFFET